MRRRLLVPAIIIVLLLAGCAAPAEPAGNDPGVPPASPTGLSPSTDTPTILLAMSTPTETATLLPTATTTPSRQVSLAAVGDIMLARSIGQQIQAQGPGIVFAGVQSAFDSADILVGNLECTLTTGGEAQPKTYTFAAPPETSKALSLAGFDLLDLANNHSMDFGSQGLIDTRNNLAQYGIATVGAGLNAAEARAPVFIERNGLRVAFLAVADIPPEYRGFDAHAWIATDTTPGIAWAYTDQITADVKAAKAQADVVIVLLHAGHESKTEIMFEQAQEAHAAIDAGAALVIGAHPHVLQQIKLYHGGLIAYSLGNFVFDEFDGKENMTAILHVVLTPAGAPAIATLVAPLP
jgi:poly-gamma-glutamate capsule biosynthesis protein CapA/YwtB (metallophosphatase superfamily)